MHHGSSSTERWHNSPLYTPFLKPHSVLLSTTRLNICFFLNNILAERLCYFILEKLLPFCSVLVVLPLHIKHSSSFKNWTEYYSREHCRAALRIEWRVPWSGLPCRPVGTATGHEPARRGSQLLRLLAVFLFLYFLFSFFTKIYFWFGNLQEYTPAAQLPGGRDLAARQRGGRGIYEKKIRGENCA